MHIPTAWILAACMTIAAPTGALARTDDPSSQGGFRLELVDDGGRPLPAYLHEGRTYVLGTAGARYRLRIHNDSGRRAEIVVSVDGRDVIDGGPSSIGKRGYLVEARREVVIDGYRLSENAVAAFRFGSVARSYAALEGDARDVGVIGVAIFPERRPRPVPLRDAPAREKSASAESLQGAPAPAAPEARRPGLGTAFGEEHESHVRQVAFVRESASPAARLTLRYDDRAGLLAAGVDVDERCEAPEQRLRRDADPFRRDAGWARPPRGWTSAGS